MGRLLSIYNPIEVKDADFADIGFIEGIDVGELEDLLGEGRHIDLRFIFGLVSQTDEAVFPSAKDASGE